ncbi:MAG: ABC transporter permease subunit [Armatimonadota bacterium]|nr:ABC transporter permease subunit [Armatimonadota bacterium]MDR7450336.1 ABC transporter permease subunit [Armatimonadota bacterium]MDR7467081.1 ABC transporter permease subunit [Armatimonadota bacterium]MDR7493377.1 ABC transporter permease subunit [Armatimonadota bacterium]MDR7499385.1 ABC transporter permease subunit [Armatimonadota bacterium]
MKRRVGVGLVAWIYVFSILLFLYLPLVPPILFSLAPVAGGNAPTVHWYGELWRNPVLVTSIKTSLLTGILTALLTPPLGLLAAMGVRELRAPRAVLLLLLMPLFIPGVSMGLGNAFLFRLLNIPPSLWTILIAHVLWALPFAFLIILTAMTTFDPVYLEAAYVHGAGRLRAFLDVELALIAPGITGAATFSFILSLNETVRTGLVQGPLNTVQTYIWSTYLQVGLSPTIYALMSLLILLTVALVLVIRPMMARRAIRVTL